LTILLSALTLIFVLITATLFPFSNNATALSGNSGVLSITVLIALLVCLAPTTIGGLLSAIGIAGMNRLAKANVIATSGRAVEAAGDVSVLLLDKTGTITFGNRQAANFIPAEGISEKELAEAAAMTSLADETPEGKSIVTLARSLGVQIPNVDTLDASFIHFSADTKLSGINLKNRQILKGADDSISTHLKNLGAVLSTNVEKIVHQIARSGGTPLVVADGTRIMGVIHLKDTVKPDIKNRLADLRKMGIKSVMITGDNPLTAAAIAAEAGVDDYLAQATPETKLKYIRKMQEGGQLVAMVGDGTNDAPALAQADVAVAMNSGTQAAKEAANMVDLDSNPTKLIEVVEVGKQLLITRGALTTFSIANDIAKYFAIIPTSLTSIYPELKIFNIMHLQTTESAILSAIIFNAFIIIMLVPLALKGVKYHAQSAESLLRNHIFIYGLGGIIA
ncbi:MAG: potassium-transporting ATPase subunit KdpB, partial [Alphaproteobacteria bacterium]|nr:potassium-transporting ATPase subunit KdpB [Alphaproteobacteria bacterium]